MRPQGDSDLKEEGMPAQTDWQTLVYDKSEYVVLRAIMAAIDRGNVLDGLAGLEEMIQLMGKREARELESRLAVLMAHILKWKAQPPGTKSWRHSIATQRREIAKLRRDAPRFTREHILAEFWHDALEDASDKAEADMDQSPSVETLTWEEVFEDPYDERSED